MQPNLESGVKLQKAEENMRKARKKMNQSVSSIIPKIPVSPTPLEMAKAALPIFGGTTPATPAAVIVTPPPEQKPDEKPAEGTPPAGDKKEDPIEKFSKDPQALGQLLAQVDKLTKDLTNANTKVSEYETKEQEAQRKTQTREQQLESDLAERDATIASMDAVIRNMAIGNAFLSNPDVRWNSVKQAMAELNPEAFDIDVDLANGTAKVTGIEHEVKRIAKDFPWLVAQAQPANPAQQTPQRPPSSGGPPAPPNGDASKATRRAELMKKYPVIASGRPI